MVLHSVLKIVHCLADSHWIGDLDMFPGFTRSSGDSSTADCKLAQRDHSLDIEIHVADVGCSWMDWGSTDNLPAHEPGNGSWNSSVTWLICEGVLLTLIAFILLTRAAILASTTMEFPMEWMSPLDVGIVEDFSLNPSHCVIFSAIFSKNFMHQLLYSHEARVTHGFK